MEGFADIADAVPLGPPWALIAAIAAGVVAAALAAYFIFRKRPEVALAPVVARRPAIEIAREALEELRRTGAELPAEPFTVRLTGVVRNYVEDALKLRALEQTTEEFLEAIGHDTRLPALMREELPHLLTQCDMVKFARQDMSPQRRLEAIQTASRVVEAAESGRGGDATTATAAAPTAASAATPQSGGAA